MNKEFKPYTEEEQTKGIGATFDDDASKRPRRIAHRIVRPRGSGANDERVGQAHAIDGDGKVRTRNSLHYMKIKVVIIFKEYRNF